MTRRPRREERVQAAVFQPELEQGIPLHEVTFCVVDLETTGGSPADCAITKVGAVKYRGGERLGVFQTLVDPGRPIPPFISHLTGLRDRDVRDERPIDWVLPGFLEFARSATFVAHNARFDFGFLNANLVRLDYDPLPPPPVCTAKLARRVVWPDVPNVRLATLAQYFRTAVRPTHRALPDAEACAEILHGLLELGGRLGILTLGDLHEAVRARGRPHFGKIRLADHLPTAAGVYLFRGRDGRVLYVGKSKDVRGRVKSYFYGDGRKKVEDLLRDTVTIDSIGCTTELEALVLEARLIHEHEPRYNRRGKTWRRYAYLKVDTHERFPRLKVVREPKGAGTYLGPFGSASAANLAKEAIEDAFPIRRCRTPMGGSTRFPPCALAGIGRCLAPCDGRVGPERYDELVRSLLSSLMSPAGLLEALEARMMRLARQERFEEASLARDRLRALSEALARSRVDGWLLGAARLVLRDRDGHELRFARGALDRGPAGAPIPAPPPRDRADEVSAVRGWLGRNPTRLVSADPPIAEPVEGGATLHRILARLRDVSDGAARRDR